MMRKNTGDNQAPLLLTSITNEHVISTEQLCAQLKTNTKEGIKDEIAKEMLRIAGKNQFERPKRRFMLNFSGFHIKRQKFSKSEWKRIFGQQIPNEVTVIRNNKHKQINGKQLVQGDIIELRKNDIVPADVRIIDSYDVFVDNRIITGNYAEPRSHEQICHDYLVSPNMVFACTRILSGVCTGIVLRTGEDTVFGTLKNFAEKVKVEKARRKHSVE